LKLQGNSGISITIIVALLAISGCGGSSHSMPPPNPGAMTNLTVLITSTANDQLSGFEMRISSLALSGSAGSIGFFNLPQGSANPSLVSEFIHLNGASEPLFSAQVLSGTYTSASLILESCEFINVSTTPAGGLQTSFFSLGQCLPATVKLPSPITISGSAAVLSLNLQVSESYTLTTTNGPNGPTQTYTIAPVFTLTPVAISSPPTNDSNGLIAGVDAKVALTDSVQHKLSVTTTGGFGVTAATNSATVYQGISGFASLAPNELVNLDMAVQSDGSLLATRIEVRDSMATGELNGPWTSPTAFPDNFVILADTCFLPASALECDSAVQFSSSIPFTVSGQFTNLSSLPFSPAFNSSVIFLGQNVSNYWLGARTPQGNPISTTAVLLPQTINGTVTEMSSTNGFSVYTVSLAPYDVIPVAQSVSGSFAPITNPSAVTVYADSDAQLLTTSSIAVGSVVRFRGAIFNDNGVLRMDCLKILDGVAE
jgi:hypothetical protein